MNFRSTWLVMLLSVLALRPLCAAEEKADSGETRKREYETVQKELEASRPAQGASREEIITYLELAKDSYGTFAKHNPKTAEGFEAAFSLAELLTQTRHPDALTYAQLATDTAPTAGVDVKRVAMSWAMVAENKLAKGDVNGAKGAIDKIKDIDKDLHEQFSANLAKVIQAIEDEKNAGERLKEGKEPFPIEGKDIGGQKFALADWKGKVVIIDFWATWCGPCMAEMPNLQDLYKEQHDKGLEVVGISLDRDIATLKKIVDEKKFGWTILFDQTLAKKWGVRSIPLTYVLDRKGVIRHIGLRGEELNQAVGKLLQEK